MPSRPRKNRDAGLAGDGNRLALGDRFSPVRLEGLHRLAARVVEVFVGRVVGRNQRHLDGLGDREKARRPDGFEPDQRIRVGGQLLERVERLRNAIAPDAKDSSGGGPGVEVGRGEDPVEQLEVDDVLVLMGPESFGQVVLIIGVGLVEPGDPRLEGRDDLRRNPWRPARSWPDSGHGLRDA